MKIRPLIGASILAGIIFISCGENNSNKDVGDTIETPLTDTVAVPTQGHEPDMSTIQIPDTVPKKDSTK